MAHNTIGTRWRHHAVLAIVSVVVYALTSSRVADPTVLDQLSFASAYICLLLMAAALSIGPLQAQRSQVLSTNIYLRRDIGIWAAVAGLVHLVVATRLAMTPHYMRMYVDISTDELTAPIRAALFLWGSIAAFIVGVLLLLLLGLSNNAAMRFLGVAWWKRLQRSAYIAVGLTVAHGLAFQIIEARGVLLMGLVLGILLLLVGLQLFGYRSVSRQRNSKGECE